MHTYSFMAMPTNTLGMNRGNSTKTYAIPFRLPRPTPHVSSPTEWTGLTKIQENMFEPL